MRQKNSRQKERTIINMKQNPEKKIKNACEIQDEEKKFANQQMKCRS